MKNIVQPAIKGDKESVDALFSQFIDRDESIKESGYHGFNGLWHFGYHSFGCVTDRRVCSLNIGWLGSVSYVDAFLEDVNSATVKQPSLLLLYILGIIFIVLTFGLGLIVLPLFVRVFYRYFKSGMSANIRGGGIVYIFCDRKKIKDIDSLLQYLSENREIRLNAVFGVASKKSST